MRRNNRDITDLNEILSIINDCKVIHLAMIDAGEPYLLPLNFGYTCENGLFSFFCHSAREGRKLDILRKNPTVAFEMDCRGALDEQDPKSFVLDFSIVSFFSFVLFFTAGFFSIGAAEE